MACRSLVALATLAVPMLVASPTLAQTCTTSWASATSGVWSEAGNWTNGVPVASSTACIAAAGTYTVTLDQNQALNELVVGGASGTQTLELAGTLNPLGSGTIGSNGRIENRSSAACGSCDGLPQVTGTLAVEGVLVHRTQTGLLSAGGMLDVAPGGRLLLDATGGVSVGVGGETPSRLRVRGQVDVMPSTTPQNTNLNGILDIDGGTVSVGAGRVFVNGEGALRDATFDIAEEAYLGLRIGFQTSGVFVAEGTMRGDVQGTLEVVQNAELGAGPEDATLDVGGNGLLFRGGSGGSVRLASAGGAFLNTGLVRFRSSGPFVRSVLFRNQGTLRIEGTTANLNEGAVLRNDADGAVELVDQGGIGAGDGTGRVENTGLLVARLEDRTTGSSSVLVSVEVDGGEIRAENDRLTLDGAHVFRNATLTAEAGSILTINGDGREGRKIVVEGTLAGDIAGDLGFFDMALEAAPAGATLDVRGTGLQLLVGSFGRRVDFDGTGGVFTNVGLVRSDGFATIRSARFRNQGTVRVPGRIEVASAGVLINEANGLVDLVQGGRIDGDGRLDNHGLITVRREVSTGSASSSFRGTLRSQPGSEVRVLKGARIQLDPPGSATLPAGVRLTGDGEVFIQDLDFALEGIVSPGTAASPIDTLSLTFGFDFSRLAGSPQLVVDVDAGGVSDRLESISSRAFKPYGALVIRVRDGYTPALGDVFTIWQGMSPNQLEGAFTQVVASGAPGGLAFVAEPNADASALLLRVVEVAPGGTIAVSETEPLGGGPRSVFLSGPGAPGVTAVRLECVECLDANEPVSVELVGEGTVREVQMDLTSPRLYGFYELVLERGTLPDTTIDLTVRPYLSYIVMQDFVNRGIGVRPAALRYNWSAMRVWNMTNGDAPGYTVAAIDREDAEQVSLALATSNPFSGRQRIFEESRPAEGPTHPILAFGRIEAARSIYLTYGQRILPENVLFPEQMPTGPDDDRIPFGEDRIVFGLAANHASFARSRDLLLDALRDTEDDALVTYLTAVEAADPGAVERGVGRTIDRNKGYLEGINGLFERILDELDDSAPVPSGLATSARPAFERALDAGTGRYLVASYEAVNLESRTAPASVLGLLDVEVARLEGREPNRAQRMGPDSSHPGGGSLCNVPPINRIEDEFGQSLGNVSLSEGDRGAHFSLRATAFAMGRVQSFDQTRQTMTAAQETIHALHQSCKTATQSMTSNRWGAGNPASGTCTLPPPPPGGPSGGGGGACGPPAAPADPNDKTANHQLPCEMGTVTIDGEEVTRCVRYYVPRQLATAPITYSVQFENLPQATANAEFVTIIDELDANLDPSTLTVLGSSADSLLTTEVSGQTATFRFVGIDLPPNVEQPEGQGFIAFSVEPRAGLADGTEIRNDASIVFDFNPAIETPEVIHEIREMSDLAVTVLSPDFDYPDQSIAVEVFVSNLQGDDAEAVTLTLELPVAASSITAPDGTCKGTTMLTCTLGTLEASQSTVITLELPPSPIGDYTITADASSATFDGFLPNNRESVGLPIVGTDAEIDPNRQLVLTAGPNPTRGTIHLRWTLPETADVELAVYDLLGREVAQVELAEHVAAGAYSSSWPAEVASGVYVVRLRAGDEVRTRRVTVLR
ncbi:MAG: hypothetical protein Rubg2KO_08500 [Rubricoccaceae bacterium]